MNLSAQGARLLGFDPALTAKLPPPQTRALALTGLAAVPGCIAVGLSAGYGTWLASDARNLGIAVGLGAGLYLGNLMRLALAGGGAAAHEDASRAATWAPRMVPLALQILLAVFFAQPLLLWLWQDQHDGPVNQLRAALVQMHAEATSSRFGPEQDDARHALAQARRRRDVADERLARTRAELDALAAKPAAPTAGAPLDDGEHGGDHHHEHHRRHHRGGDRDRTGNGVGEADHAAPVDVAPPETDALRERERRLLAAAIGDEQAELARRQRDVDSADARVMGLAIAAQTARGPDQAAYAAALERSHFFLRRFQLAWQRPVLASAFTLAVILLLNLPWLVLGTHALSAVRAYETMRRAMVRRLVTAAYASTRAAEARALAAWPTFTTLRLELYGDPPFNTRPRTSARRGQVARVRS